MKRSLFFVLAFLSFSNLAFSQNPSSYAFKVLVSKGKSEVKSGEKWSEIKVGSSLKAVDEIKLSENSYLGLIHATGKPLEIKDAGNHRVADLANRLGRDNSVLNKYTDFILSSNDTKRSRLAATGAVHRGTKESITVYLPEPQRDKVYGDRIILDWTKLEDEPKGYIVIVRNLFEEELARYETAENLLELNLASKELAETNDFMVKVISASNPTQASKEFAMRRLKAKERAEVNKSLNELGTSLAGETALNKFILAGFYEEKYLIIDAITAYQDAIRLAPEVSQYKDAYEDFLSRIGFTK